MKSRLLQVLPTLLLVSILVFSLQQLMPGDPATILAGEERGDPVVLQQIRNELWLDRSIPVQYLHWIGNVLRGDFGTSWRIRQPVLVLGAWTAYAPYGATKQSIRAVFAQQYARLTGVRIEMSEAGSHFLMYDDPQWFLAQADAFLKQPALAKK